MNFDYINCVIQALISHRDFRAFFSVLPEADQFKHLQRMAPQTRNLIKHLVNLTQLLTASQYDEQGIAQNQSLLIKSIKSRFSKYNDDQQHDVREFFEDFISMLSDAMPESRQNAPKNL